MAHAPERAPGSPRRSVPCAFCGQPTEVLAGRGRKRSYCRPSHRQRAYEERRIARAREAAAPSTRRRGSPTPPRTRESSDVRAAIQAAARSLLSERGLEGTTLREIAQRAGVAYGTVPYHFGSKEQLVLRVLLEEGRELQRDAERMSRIADPAARRRSLRDALRARVHREPDLFRLRFEFFALALRNETYRQALAEMLEGARVSTAENLVHAGFRETDGALLAPVLQAAVDGLALQALVDGDFDHDAAHIGLVLLLARFRQSRAGQEDRNAGGD